MKKSAKNSWQTFDQSFPKPHKWVLVTNNLDARNAHGLMSHLWLVDFVQKSEIPNNGYIAFQRNMEVINLTHWRYALPDEGDKR